MRKLHTKRKLVLGWGINNADYPVCYRRKGEPYVTCKYYATWQNMISRCYGPMYKCKSSGYYDCSISEDWKYFMNFRSWMEKQDWEGKYLDKDLLFVGNKIYSADTCVFIDRKVNNFIVKPLQSGELPTGVVVERATGKYVAKINYPNNYRKHLGIFKTPEEARHAYRVAKYELALKLAEEQADPRVAEALIKRYYVEPNE